MPKNNQSLSKPSTARLLATRHESTLVLTISNPRLRNAMHPSIYYEGLRHVREALNDESIRAIVLTGDGAHFSTGGDLHRLEAQRKLPEEEQRTHLDALHNWVQALQSSPLPVIAAVEGVAAGGGFSLCLACDLIVAAEDARFVMSYIGVALSPDGGATAGLCQALPSQLVLEMLWDGQPFDARRLHGYGIVNRVVASGTALGEALRWAKRLANGPRGAQADIKLLVRAAHNPDLRGQLDAEREAFIGNLYSDECGHAIHRFLQSRLVSGSGSASD